MVMTAAASVFLTVMVASAALVLGSMVVVASAALVLGSMVVVAATAALIVIVAATAAIVVVVTAAALVFVIYYCFNSGKVIGDGINLIAEIKSVFFELFNVKSNGFKNVDDSGKKPILLVFLV